MRETYGDFITVERTINASGGGGYKILNENGEKYFHMYNQLIFPFNI